MAGFKANSENIGIFRIFEKNFGENIYAFQSYRKIRFLEAILDLLIDQPILDEEQTKFCIPDLNGKFCIGSVAVVIANNIGTDID